MRYVEVWLREADAGTDNACWVPALKGDPGAYCFSATLPVAARARKEPKARRRDDRHYDSQGYCDNPARGY